jgi:hypothetical protein
MFCFSTGVEKKYCLYITTVNCFGELFNCQKSRFFRPGHDMRSIELPSINTVAMQIKSRITALQCISF